MIKMVKGDSIGLYYDEIERLKKKICELERKIQYEKEMNERNVFYDIDIFPSSINTVNNLYIPKKFQIECTGEKCSRYQLDYDDVYFSILDRPDESYPYSFTINNINDPKIKIEDKEEIGIPLLVKIYYQNPEQITNSKKLVEGNIIELNNVIDRAKIELGTKWSNSYSFGFIVFYYWIRLFYKLCLDNIENDEYDVYEKLYDIFHYD